MKKSLHITDQAAPSTWLAHRQDAQRNHDRILQACRALLRASPTSTPSMDAVAEKAGVGKGTLYRHFADKSALFLALLDTDARALQDHVQHRCGLPKGGCPHEQLRALWSALVEFAVDHAEVLAVAEHHVSLGELFDSTPNHWRSVELQRHLRAVGMDAALVPMLGDALLAALTSSVIRRERARGGNPQQTLMALLAHTTARLSA
jgi:AcrR family transcriptional regulator